MTSLCLTKITHKEQLLMEIITKNDRNSNERTVCSLKEIEKRKIVEHNDLITSVAKMDKTPLKILATLVMRSLCSTIFLFSISFKEHTVLSLLFRSFFDIISMRSCSLWVILVKHRETDFSVWFLYAFIISHTKTFFNKLSWYTLFFVLV